MCQLRVTRLRQPQPFFFPRPLRPALIQACPEMFVNGSKQLRLRPEGGSQQWLCLCIDHVCLTMALNHTRQRLRMHKTNSTGQDVCAHVTLTDFSCPFHDFPSFSVCASSALPTKKLVHSSNVNGELITMERTGVSKK